MIGHVNISIYICARIFYDFVMIEGYLTTKEVAEKLNVSEGRIRQLIAEKRLPTIKIGNSNLIKESDLVAVQERKRTGRPKKNANHINE
ncbi:MAG TPA: helix-turn-helix domain-containing protein [Pyrinomonadaceae bacterium]|jgi:excisionase family DNA binding protein